MTLVAELADSLSFFRVKDVTIIQINTSLLCSDLNYFPMLLNNHLIGINDTGTERTSLPQWKGKDMLCDNLS